MLEGEIRVIPKKAITIEMAADYAYSQCPEVGEQVDSVGDDAKDAVAVSAWKLRMPEEGDCVNLYKQGKLFTLDQYAERIHNQFLLQITTEAYDDFGKGVGYNWAELMIAHATLREYQQVISKVEAEVREEKKCISVQGGPKKWPHTDLFVKLYKNNAVIREALKKVEAIPEIKRLQKESCKRRKVKKPYEKRDGYSYISQVAYRFRIYSWIICAAYARACENRFSDDLDQLMLMWITADLYKKAIIAIETVAEMQNTLIMPRAQLRRE